MLTDGAASHQVFISHIREDSEVANLLRAAILQAFGDKIRVFSAFDDESIGRGQAWFNEIIENLRRSAVVLVLASSASRRKPWINFEAGFGIGANADVIPLSVRNFPLGQLDYPLAGFQASSVEQLLHILIDISKKTACDFERNSIDFERYKQATHEAEGKLTYRSIEAKFRYEKQRITVSLHNKGNVDLELLMLELFVPIVIIEDGWIGGASQLFHVRTNDKNVYWIATTSSRGAFGRVPPWLPPVLTPDMGEFRIDALSIPLHQKFLAPNMPIPGLPIYYHVHVVIGLQSVKNR